MTKNGFTAREYEAILQRWADGATLQQLGVAFDRTPEIMRRHLNKARARRCGANWHEMDREATKRRL